MNLGLFIGRMNPPHNGHIEIIKRALEENSKVLVLLGTSFLKDVKNPFDFDFRKLLLEKVIENKRLKILELKDMKSDLEWINNIIKILDKNFSNIKNINFYGGDFKNDSAYNTFVEYKNKLKKYNINYILSSRNNSYVEFEGNKYSISATNLRESLKSNRDNLSLLFTNKKILALIKEKSLKS